MAIVKALLKDKYKMKDLEYTQLFISLNIKQDRKKGLLHLHQSNYLTKILISQELQDCKTITTPPEDNQKLHVLQEADPQPLAEETQNFQSIVGKLMYAITSIHPYLALTHSALRRYTSCPGIQPQTALKRVLGYFQQTKTYGLLFSSTGSKDLVGFSDSDWRSDTNDRKSITGYVFKLAGAAVSWKSCK